MSGETATNKCRYCKKRRSQHVADDPSKMPSCPDGSGKRFKAYMQHGRRSMSFNECEIVTLRKMLERHPRYGPGASAEIEALRVKFKTMHEAMKADGKPSRGCR